MEGFGPEHYFLSCDKSQIQTGTYEFKLANFAGAKGRKATLQLATFNDGVRLTKTIELGDETEDFPAYHIFNLSITNNDKDNLTVNMQ